MTCKFWLKGTCRKGDSCPFSHTSTKMENKDCVATGSNMDPVGRRRSLDDESPRFDDKVREEDNRTANREDELDQEELESFEEIAKTLEELQRERMRFLRANGRLAATVHDV